MGALSNKGEYSSRQIAKQLNCHHSMISRELKRKCTRISQDEILNKLAQHIRVGIIVQKRNLKK